ncbi:hypothetical protein D3C78_1814690 [compost metagenome]
MLAFTAAKMITHEKAFQPLFENSPAAYWTFVIVIIILTITVGWYTNARRRQGGAQANNGEAR